MRDEELEIVRRTLGFLEANGVKAELRKMWGSQNDVFIHLSGLKFESEPACRICKRIFTHPNQYKIVEGELRCRYAHDKEK